MNKHHRILPALLSAAVLLLTATPLSAAAAEETTPSGIAYDAIPAAVEQYAEDEADSYAAFSASVVSADDVLFTGAFGHADDETVYEWGSVSKMLVWVSVMQLWEQGRLDLDADVRTYLPDGFLHKTRYPDPITMTDLMSHRGGWGENVWALQTDDPAALPTLADALSDTEPYQLLPPGTVSSYSNYGAALAAYVVEEITGEPFVDYVHTHILDPLGMTQTAVAPDRSDNEWVQQKRSEVVCYSETGPGEWTPAGSRMRLIKIYPAGAVTGTIGDMARFAQSLVQEPCPLFTEPETLETMLTPTAYVGSSDVASYCHGLMPEVTAVCTTYGHGGSTDGFSSNLRFDPESGLAVCVLMNGHGAPPDEVPALVFGDPSSEDAAPTAGTDAPTIDPTGVYFGMRGMWHGPLRVMSVLNAMPVMPAEDGTLNIAGVATATHLGGDVYAFEQDGIHATLAFTRDSEGRAVADLGGQGYVRDRGMLATLVFTALYVIITVIGVATLLTRSLLGGLVALLTHKRRKYLGMWWITAARVARLLSVAALVGLAGMMGPQYGITHAQGIVFAAVEVLCMAVFGAAAVSDVRCMTAKEGEKARRFVYITNILWQIISIAALLCLEVWRVWGV